MTQESNITEKKKMKPNIKRHLIFVGIAMAIYLGSLGMAEVLIDHGGMSGAPAIALAIVPGLCVGSLILFFALLVIEEKDEFQRLLYVRQGAVATVFTFTLAGVWGFLERYIGIAGLEGFWWPTIWCFSLPLGMLFNKLTMGTAGEM